MINSSRTFNQPWQLIGWACVLIGLLCGSTPGLAKSYSDLLIVVDQDGVGYTAQLTVFTDEEMVVSQVPPGRDTLETVFAGSRSAVYRRAHEKNPDKITVISGSVFSRFRHRFNTRPYDLDDAGADNDIAPAVRIELDDFATTMANTQTLNFRVSWMLPPNIELLDYGAQSLRADIPDDAWRKRDNTLLTFEKRGAAPSELWLAYRVHAQTSKEESCLATLGPSEWCSPDSDGDGVPDYRDMCVATELTVTGGSASAEQPAVLADDGYDELMIGAKSTTASVNSLGCEDDQLIILSDVQFENSQTYLNVKSRTTLDKLAVALKRMPDKRFSIASHTDNVGPRKTNQELSDNRASAIRHYLMLRGIGPNQVRANGYGETQPAHDNKTAQGRRANRRVELQRLN